jgi:flavin reductase (DIM6/NTAB) family NADH-FMN oxidoreductase RutF
VNAGSADKDVYRSFMSAFPTGVAVVTTVGSCGEPRGLTCSSLSSVSLAPPILSVCLGAWSGTLAALRAHGHFAVNLLGTHGRDVAELFANASSDHFDRLAWRPAAEAGLPRLCQGTLAFAACRVVATQLVGDHVLVLGEVISADCADGVPLLYGLRQFAAWPGTPARLGWPASAARHEEVVDGAR